MELIFRRKPLSDDPVSSCLLGQGGGAERGEWVEGGSGAERGEWVEGGSGAEREEWVEGGSG